MERLDANTLLAATIGTAIVIGILVNDTKPQPQPQPQPEPQQREAPRK